MSKPKDDLENIKRVLRRVRLYVVAVYPHDVIMNGRQGEYTPWFIAHVDETRLTPETLKTVFEAFKVMHKPDEDEIMEMFTHWLAKNNYIVLNSAICAGGFVTLEYGNNNSNNETSSTVNEVKHVEVSEP